MSIVPQEEEKPVSKKQAEAEPELSPELKREHEIKQMGKELNKACWKNEETISGLFSQIRSMVDYMKIEHEDGQFFVEALQRLSLGEASESFEEEEKERLFEGRERLFEQYEQASAIQNLSYKEWLFEQYEQTRQKQKSIISEFADKIAQLEESLKKKEKDDGEFSTLLHTLIYYRL